MNISTIYTDSNRVFMEFIDNSVDAAERENILMNLLNSEETEFQMVEIMISIMGKTYRNGNVKITDNCTGMNELRKVVERIGNSEKKSQPWLNGQFGYGIYSFMSICERLEIRTKHKDNLYSEYIIIRKDDFLIDDLNDLKFDITIEHPHTPVSGTEIILSGFYRDNWQEIDASALKEEIERHFELLLRNPNIKIIIKSTEGKTILCTPYDYNRHQGVVFEKKIKIPVKEFDLNDNFGRNEIELFLKFSPKISVERPPVIFSNNRRVIELCQIKFNLFRTFKKRELWNNPSIYGYTNTKNMLNPTLARNDFKNDKNFRLVRKALLEIEDEILEKFKEAAEAATSSDFSEIESGFNSELDSLIDNTFNVKKDIRKGDYVKISDSSGKLMNILIPEERGEIETEFSTGRRLKGRRKNRIENNLSEQKEINQLVQIREFVTPMISNERKLFLKIDDSSEPIKDNNGKDKRSELFGNTVHIYKKHTDFLKRITTSALGVELISSELITYLASEMLIHYTNYSFEQNKNNKQSDRKEVLIFFTDWLYKLEDSLKKLIGKPLSK